MTPESICDPTQCPLCVVENKELGGGVGFADSYFNSGGHLWAVCSVHQVRWVVTREMMGAPDVRDRLGEPLLALSEGRD